MTGPETRPEILNGEPFVIRGHHLMHYMALLSLLSPTTRSVEPSRPLGLAKSLRRMAEEAKLGNFDYPISSGDNEDRIQKSFEEYGKDLLGDQGDNEYENKNSKIFSDFLSLPGNYPADIVEGIPDAMCSACVIGKHCKKFNGFTDIDPYADDAVKFDGKDLDYFLRLLQNNHLPEPTIIPEEAQFSDANPQPVRRIRTTIGIVRKTLSGFNVTF